MEDLVGSVGRNLRRYRTLRGLSASEVAQQSQIARATLSALEAGRGNPTLDTLAAVADVLGVDVPELMTVNGSVAMTVVRARDDETESAGGDHDGMRLLRCFRAGPCAIDMYDLHLTEGASKISDGHSEGALEHILVQVGRLELRLDPDNPSGKHAVLGPGDYVSFTADVPHVYAAVGGEVRGTLIMHYAATLERPPVPVEVGSGNVTRASQPGR
jgi:transcriptional regulator with XRE-family HTH domain